MRLAARQSPLQTPYFVTASMAYCEQLGVNLHVVGGSRGEMRIWYPRRRTIMARFISANRQFGRHIVCTGRQRRFEHPSDEAAAHLRPLSHGRRTRAPAFSVRQHPGALLPPHQTLSGAGDGFCCAWPHCTPCWKRKSRHAPASRLSLQPERNTGATVHPTSRHSLPRKRRHPGPAVSLPFAPTVRR